MKQDWQALQREYLEENQKSGVSVQDWCAKKGLNYNSARRHIKSRAALPDDETEKVNKPRKTGKRREKKADSAPKPAQETPTEDAEEEPEQEPDVIPARNQSLAEASGRNHSSRSGNPNPKNQFDERNQAARIHGGYAKYLTAEDADILFTDAEYMDLHDELRFVRARSLKLTSTLTKIFNDMRNEVSVETKVELYDLYLKAEQALERNIARIESIHRTISGLRINDIQEGRYRADTNRIIQAQRKLKAEADNLERDTGTSDTPMQAIVNQIRSSNNGGGLMNTDINPLNA